MAVNTSTFVGEDVTPVDASSEGADVGAWQRRLLPFMLTVLGLLSAFFFVATAIQLWRLDQRIAAAPVLDLTAVLGPAPDAAAPASFASVQWRTLALLESHALVERYHQANVLLMARLWIQYLGFVTGMILSLVGATFILGKLRESMSRARLDTAAGKVGVQSSSPGIVLAVLGTVLMLATMLVHNDIDVHDGPLYVALDAHGGAPAPPDGWPPADPGKELSSTIRSHAPSPEPAQAK